MDSEDPDQDIPCSSSNSKSSSDREDLNSSIEALNWSDIEEELAEGSPAGFLSNSLTSISSLGEKGVRAQDVNTADADPSLSGGSVSTSTLSVELEQEEGLDLDKEANMVTLNAENQAHAPGPHEILDEKQESEFGSGDQTSNAPVLDDGVSSNQAYFNYSIGLGTPSDIYSPLKIMLFLVIWPKKIFSYIFFS